MPQQFIDFAFVKENASFEAVLAHYNLQKVASGDQWTVLCPFHNERKPSCKINPARKIFHCFGCEAKGNVLEFVARIEGEPDDLRSAALKLAGICRIPVAAPRGSGKKPAAVPQDERKAAPTGKDTRKPTKAPGGAPNGSSSEVEPEAFSNAPLSFELKLDPEHPYLAERGLSEETIAEFGLGYCSRGSMAGRICIPIHDQDGALLAYAGRWPDDESIPEGEDRYKLPPKFGKNLVLFNLHRVKEAKHFDLNPSFLVLVEGYWSVFRLHSLGIPAVALMGRSISPAQIWVLRNAGFISLAILMDGDEPGRRAREKLVVELGNSFFVRAPLLPEGEKPDTVDESTLLSYVWPSCV